MRLVAVSDTHAPRFWKRCPPALATEFEGADLILHAGDVCTAGVLDELAMFAPVRVVLGNNDGPDVAAWGAAEAAELELDGVRIGMIHDSGPKNGRLPRLRRRFPAADLVIFGHSHIPWDTADSGLRILNPGSPTDKRGQPHGTFAELIIDAGEVITAKIIQLS
ncbi:MAG: metallophosphatase family protein [Microlunatus sp.]|nr:metallophosphatase family protein [Microlunatus sp.]MDN5770984.1 metallophosphatase family protein [Microlunatus sp.]MDN5804198.1 metallophosphatase family protein [Microlunatus sp.]